MRRTSDAGLKAKVALEAIKGEKAVTEISSKYGIHPNQVGKWKKEALERLPELFNGKIKKRERAADELQAELYQQIGQLKVELDWLKKISVAGVEEKRLLIDKHNLKIPLIRQCNLLDLARSTCYYQSCRDDSYNELIMRLIDEEYTRHPFRGREQMTDWLRSIGYPVNHKRVGRLMQKMGIQAIYPKRKTSIPNKGHKVFPYLSGGMRIEYPNQVWATDITYIRMHPGWVYLVAIMDWYSRYVIGWEISNTMDVHFCLGALGAALARHKPNIFNSDQASQFTSRDFTEMLEAAGVGISMDGRGRVYDNIFIERLCGTVKYEEVYLHDYHLSRK